jgi:hypothetical protein
MILTPATADDIRLVALGMRDRDFAEAEPTCWTEDRAGVADELVERLGSQRNVFAVAPRAGEPPVCIAGAIPVRPNNLGLVLFATDQWPLVSGRLTRFLKRSYIPAAIRDGVHRLEAITLDGHTEAHKWLRYLGLQADAPLINYGKRGETFWVFSRVCG